MGRNGRERIGTSVYVHEGRRSRGNENNTTHHHHIRRWGALARLRAFSPHLLPSCLFYSSDQHTYASIWDRSLQRGKPIVVLSFFETIWAVSLSFSPIFIIHYHPQPLCFPSHWRGPNP